MTTSVIYADADDGTVSAQSTAYSTARTGTGTAVGDTQSFVTVGQRFASPNYSCYEGFLAFNCSAIGPGATISAAVLDLWGFQDLSTTDFTMEWRLLNWSTPLAFASYVSGASLASTTPLLCHFDTSTPWATGAYNTMVDDAMAANINQGGSTRMMGSSSRERNNNTPSGEERVTFRSTDQTGTAEDPMLTVTWTAGGGGGAGKSQVVVFG